jgi:hypothetical protein
VENGIPFTNINHIYIFVGKMYIIISLATFNLHLDRIQGLNDATDRPIENSTCYLLLKELSVCVCSLVINLLLSMMQNVEMTGLAVVHYIYYFLN